MNNPGSGAGRTAHLDAGNPVPTPAAVVDRSNVKEKLRAAYRASFGLDAAEPAFVEKRIEGSFVSAWTSTVYAGSEVFRIYLLADGTVQGSSFEVRRPLGTFRVAVIAVDYGNTNITSLLNGSWRQAQADINEFHRSFAEAHGYGRPLVQFENTNIAVSSKDLSDWSDEVKVKALMRSKGSDPANFDLFIVLDLDAEHPRGGRAASGGDFIYLGYIFSPAAFADLTRIFFNGRSMLYFLAQAAYGHECGHIFGWEHEWTPEWRIELLPFITDPMLFGWVDTNANGAPEIADGGAYGSRFSAPLPATAFPFFSGAASAQTASLSRPQTGIVLVNLGSSEASVSVSAMDREGRLLVQDGLANPRLLKLRPFQQVGFLDRDLFGAELVGREPTANIRLEKGGGQVQGWVLGSHGNLESMDGFNIPAAGTTSAVLPEVADPGSTLIHVANLDTSVATVTFDLMKSDGGVRAPSVLRSINVHGVVSEKLADLFPEVRTAVSDYVRIRSNREVAAFEVLTPEGADGRSLSGQDVFSGSTILFSPEYAAGSRWQTRLTVVNLDFRPGTVTFQVAGDDGSRLGAPQTRSLPAGGKITVAGPEELVPLVQGSVKVTSDGVRISGSAAFSVESGGPAGVTSLPLVVPSNTLLFNYAVGGNSLDTGIAMLNPNSVATTAWLEAFSFNGTLVASRSATFSAGGRSAGLLGDWFPELANHGFVGYVRASAPLPIAGVAIIGSQIKYSLASVPPVGLP